MHPAIAFMREFPQTPATICSEPVMAWLRSQGVAHPFDSKAQRRAFERLGFVRSINEVLRRVGFALKRPRNVREGEPVIFEAPNGLVLCGVAGPDGTAVAASSGAVLITPARFVSVARPVEE